MVHIRNKELHTDRLVLKSLTEESKADMMILLDNKEIKKTYMLPDFKNEEEKEIFFYRLKAISENLDRFVYGIYLKNKVIGFLNEVSKDNNTIELGYIIDPAFWNKGYATEAMGASIKELFRIGYNHVKAAHFEGNIASARVMQKCGMTLSGETEDLEYRKEIKHCIYYQIDNPNPVI